MEPRPVLLGVVWIRDSSIGDNLYNFLSKSHLLGYNIPKTKCGATPLDDGASFNQRGIYWVVIWGCFGNLMANVWDPLKDPRIVLQESYLYHSTLNMFT